MFRQQILNNTKNRTTNSAAVLNNNVAASGYNRFNRASEGDQYFNHKQMYDDDNGVDQVPFDGANMADDTFDDLKHELDLAFGGPCDSADEDDSDDGPEAANDASVLFSYTEKRFTEDDISDIGRNGDRKFIITVPDEMRERKCDACRKRFMLKESFEQHLKECIELKLLVFITESHQLLTIRKAKSLSAHEFVRRMIFSLKKMIKSLALCYKEVADVPDDMKNTKVTDDIRNNLLSIKDNWNNSNDLDVAVLAAEPNKNYLNLLEGKPNVLIKKNQFAKPSLIPPEQPILSPIPIVPDVGNHSNLTAKQPHAPSNLLNHLMPAIQQNARIHQSSPIETIVAQCSPCSESFTSLGLFEEHNRQFHNMARNSPSTVSNASSTPPEFNFTVIKSSSKSNDILNADERNTLLERLACRSINF